MVSYIALLLQLGAAGALVVAGSSKLTEPSAIRKVIGALRMPWSSALAAVLAVMELGAGLALMLLPGTWLTSGLVITLAVTFTVAAVLALRGHLQVECACFGSSLPTQLGWRQVALAPMWAAVAVSVIVVPVALAGQRLLVTFVVISLIGMGKLYELRPVLTEHRTQRRIIEGSK